MLLSNDVFMGVNQEVLPMVSVVSTYKQPVLSKTLRNKVSYSVNKQQLNYALIFLT